WLHYQVRLAWGFGEVPMPSIETLIKESYRGVRPAPGYPACPDHTEKTTLWTLLHATEHTGITLTESFAMHPPCSVSGWYFSHPEASYFRVGNLGRDQIHDYAERKGMPVADVERWLQMQLAYDESQ